MCPSPWQHQCGRRPRLQPATMATSMNILAYEKGLTPLCPLSLYLLYGLPEVMLVCVLVFKGPEVHLKHKHTRGEPWLLDAINPAEYDNRQLQIPRGCMLSKDLQCVLMDGTQEGNIPFLLGTPCYPFKDPWRGWGGSSGWKHTDRPDGPGCP